MAGRKKKNTEKAGKRESKKDRNKSKSPGNNWAKLTH